MKGFLRRAAAFASPFTLLLACGASPAPPPQPAPKAQVSSSPVPAKPTDATLDALDRIVRENFYSPDVLVQRRWSEHVQQARRELATRPAEQAEILGRLVESLHTSHTEYFAPSDPRYAQILSIFEPILKASSKRCPNPSVLPPMPIQAEDIDVWWRSFDGHWFVGGVFEGGVAEHAGLLLGDEVVSADGHPFAPVGSFAGKAGAPVRLAVRRVSGGPLLDVAVTPRKVAPQTAFREAMHASARIVERSGAKVGYVHVWSWAGDEMQDELEDAIDRLNQQGATHLVLDIRDGWGGAAPSFIRIFDRNVPVFDARMRDGHHYHRDAQIRVPAALLINRGSRSGKEGIAYAVKEHHLATLVGERTGGSVLPGGLFCLDDGAALYLAIGDLDVDGERLEGKGVGPDREIPFDLRYAGGRDPQVEGAIEAVVGKGGGK
ncbi:MAG TPA: S41 family peptidase [Polyangiaceae bacterium]|jgi:carboxyl-terminal processing protease